MFANQKLVHQGDCHFIPSLLHFKTLNDVAGACLRSISADQNILVASTLNSEKARRAVES